ncbi:hypothetical protein BDV33DRAFT_124095 [Aspergillus novoparasiticus]|uniref:Uncharacterized protein n=1 Tax=Aspergillus novoparasiticus TaxID=986946 RepID=A0A5N6F851_9EURO|nr:hypothetical protein BDV33DRAFT_124095 [Aspergillus novoparasiticus]
MRSFELMLIAPLASGSNLEGKDLFLNQSFESSNGKFVLFCFCAFFFLFLLFLFLFFFPRHNTSDDEARFHSQTCSEYNPCGSSNRTNCCLTKFPSIPHVVHS